MPAVPGGRKDISKEPMKAGIISPAFFAFFRCLRRKGAPPHPRLIRSAHSPVAPKTGSKSGQGNSQANCHQREKAEKVCTREMIAVRMGRSPVPGSFTKGIEEAKEVVENRTEARDRND